MDPLGRFHDFSQHASTFARSPALCSSTFHRDLFLQLLNPHHKISAVTALQAAAQLGYACLIFRVLRDKHLSIDRPACPFVACPSILGPRISFQTTGVRLLFYCGSDVMPPHMTQLCPKEAAMNIDMKRAIHRCRFCWGAFRLPSVRRS